MKKIFIVLLFSSMAFAQGVRIDQPILTNGPNVPSTGGPLPQALFVANATELRCLLWPYVWEIFF